MTLHPSPHNIPSAPPSTGIPRFIATESVGQILQGTLADNVIRLIQDMLAQVTADEEWCRGTLYPSSHIPKDIVLTAASKRRLAAEELLHLVLHRSNLTPADSTKALDVLRRLRRQDEHAARYGYYTICRDVDVSSGSVDCCGREL